MIPGLPSTILLTKIRQKYRFDLVPGLVRSRHQYGSMGRQPSSKFTLEHRLNLSLKFYDTFQESYTKNPQARRHMIERIISGAARVGNFKIFLSYAWLHFCSYFSPWFLFLSGYRYIGYRARSR